MFQLIRSSTREEVMVFLKLDRSAAWKSSVEAKKWLLWGSPSAKWLLWWWCAKCEPKSASEDRERLKEAVGFSSTWLSCQEGKSRSEDLTRQKVVCPSLTLTVLRPELLLGHKQSLHPEWRILAAMSAITGEAAELNYENSLITTDHSSITTFLQL